MASRIQPSQLQDGVPGAECSSQSSAESMSADVPDEDRKEAKDSYDQPTTATTPTSSPPREFVREAAKRVQGTLDSLQQWAQSPPNSESMTEDHVPRKNSVSASFLKAFTSCAGLTTEARQCVGLTVHESMDEIRHAFRPRVPSEDFTLVSDEGGDSQQLHRLASWNTIQSTYTVNTAYTNASEVGTLYANRDASNGPAAVALDDDGHPIDPKLLETRARAAASRSKPKRKRVVQFDYPPISSLRQCPRPDPQDLPQLFFTESELDQLEDDRFSTYVADDVEIVAVSTSHSEEAAPPAPLPSPEPATPRPANFSYVSTPQQAKRTTFFDKGTNSNSQKRTAARRPATPGRRASGSGAARTETVTPEKAPTPKAVPKEKRLIKSVQIYLRERSTQA